MQSQDIYNNIVQSIVKYTMDFKADACPEFGYVNWDAHSQVSELPPGNLIGPAGCGLSEEEDGIHLVFSIGVCTDNDENLFNLTGIISKLYGRLRPQTKLAVYDHATAQPVSWMVLRTPIAVTPVTKTEIRAQQFINCSALIDPKATS